MRRRLAPSIACLALLLSRGALGSQAPSSSPAGPSDAPLLGDWVGWAYLDEGGDLPLRLRIERGPDGLAARFDELVSRRYDLPVRRLDWRPPNLVVERRRPSGSEIELDLTLSAPDTLSGRLDWAGHAGDAELARSPEAISRTPPEGFADLEGTYLLDGSRTLVVGSRFWGELLFTDLESGRYGTLFPTDTDRFFAGSAMYVPAPIHARARFLRDDDGRPTGLEWEEAGRPALAGRRIAFEEEEVSFESDGVRLAGTLIRPQGAAGGEGRLPAVALVGGSNWETREGTRRDGGIFASFGLAALIYDKRGFGKSGGETVVPFAQTARDAVAAVDYLAGRDDVLADQVGLTGRSRGGWVAPLAASLSSRVAFLVLFVAPAVSPARQETTRRLNKLRDGGASEAVVAAARNMLEAAWAWAAAGPGEGDWQAYAAARRRAVKAGVPEGLLEPADAADPDWRWTRLNMAYDPLPALSSLRCPVLALFGERDRNVTVADNLPLMRRALAGDPDATLLVVPEADHGLRVVPPGGPVAPHRRVGFGPGGWPEVAAWLGKRLALGSGAPTATPASP